MGQHLIHYKVSGKVQGVFFRKYTQQEATNLGLRGWCHNHPDSTVEGVAVGTSEKIGQFKSWLKKGSPQSKVEEVEVIKEAENAGDDEIQEALGDGKGYEVRKYRTA